MMIRKMENYVRRELEIPPQFSIMSKVKERGLRPGEGVINDIRFTSV